MPSSPQYLGIYLNDHLAGSTTAIEMLRYAARQHAGTELGRFLAGLGGEIEEDRTVLREMMAAAGVSEQRHKLVAAWLLEKVRRLKLNGELLRRSPLSTLVELETLTLGIHGKAQGWRALQAAAGEDVYAGKDLPGLIARAQRQHEAVEERRRAAAREALE
jgi:hypothetical protein